MYDFVLQTDMLHCFFLFLKSLKWKLAMAVINELNNMHYFLHFLWLLI